MQTEAEIRESHRQHERLNARLYGSSKKPNGAAIVRPFSLGETIETGLTVAKTAKQPQTEGIKRGMLPGEQNAASTVAGPTENTGVQGGGGGGGGMADATGPTGNTGSTGNTGPTHTQPGPNATLAKQSGTSLPKFDHATALEFYNAVRPSAFILGFTQGRSITSAKEFQALVKKADDQREHLFFPIATLKPEWGDPKTHAKGKITTPSIDKAVNMPDGSTSHVLECPYLWGDCDAEKYSGNDPEEAAKHYENEGSRVKTAIDKGLLALGITPSAVWRSGAGWQFLIKLDQAIEPYEAEILVGKLHVALGFDAVVRNPNRIIRVPGSVNWKNGKDGRVPSPCVPLQLLDAVTKIDEVRKALANVAEPEKEANAKAQKEGHTFKRADEYEPIDPDDPALAQINPKWSHDDYAAVYMDDRSRAAFGFVCECKRAGVADDVIARCLMHWPIGTCLREKPNVDRELVRILERGDEFAADPKLAEMNEKHHVVLHGGKTRVLTWDEDEIYKGRKVPVYQTPEDFKAFHSKYRHTYQIKIKIKDDKGNETGETETKTVTKALGSWWWEHKQRRQYEGLTYAPSTDADVVGGKLNLWTGYTVAPVKGRLHVGYLKHLRDNVCQGNRAHYDHLIRLMARAVQLPDQRAEIGVVLIGPKGVGKNVGVEEFGKLFGPHFWTVTNPDHFTGKFNSHLQHCSILLADECLKPENKVHEQIAKTLVTGQTILIEPKGVNAYQVKNFLHVFICTNNKWAIPATADERRWFILIVGEKHRKDFPYFKKICDDMDASGRANLLHYLLNLDLSKFEFRDVPETEAMLDQQERTRNGVELMVEGWCRDGIAPFSRPDKPHVIITSGSDDKIPWGFDNFIHSKAPEDLRRLGPTRIKRALTKEWGTSHFHGRVDGELVSGIELPTLATLRKTFEARCNNGKRLDWPAVNEWVSDHPSPAEQTADDVGAPDASDVALGAQMSLPNVNS